MVEFLLHSGTGHPQFLWIVVASILTLGLGVLVGLYVDRIRTLFVAESPDANQRE